MELGVRRVPNTAKPTSDIRFRWERVEPLVWTNRMLWALENVISGVEGRTINVYFGKLGLFSLSTARVEAISPQRG